MNRIRQPISYKETVFWGIIGILLAFGFYEYLSYNQHLKNPTNTTMPNVTQLFAGFKQMCTYKPNPFFPDQKVTAIEKFFNTMIVRDIIATYFRLLSGIFIGCLIGTFIGILMGSYEVVAALFTPIFSILSKTPGTGMLAVFMTMFGTSEYMYVPMIAFGITPLLAQSVYLSIKHDVHDEEIDKAYTLGASSIEVIWNVMFKQILPKILDNVRLQIGPAMVCLIAAEMMNAQVGIGYQIRMQQKLLNMSIVYNYLMISGLLGLLMDKLMLTLRRVICPWFSRYR